MFPEMKYIKLEMNIAVGILGLLQWSDLVLIGCYRRRGAFISAPPWPQPMSQPCPLRLVLPKADAVVPTSNVFSLCHSDITGPDCSTNTKCTETLTGQCRLCHGFHIHCLHQRGENSCSHGLRNNLLIPLPSGKAKSYPDSLVKKIQTGCDCGLPPNPYGPSENKCVCVCLWVGVCLCVCLWLCLLFWQNVKAFDPRIRAGYISHCSVRQHYFG